MSQVVGRSDNWLAGVASSDSFIASRITSRPQLSIDGAELKFKIASVML